MNLQVFCADPAVRAMFSIPFSFEQNTYATDGHIAIRLPRDERVKIRDSAGDLCKRLFEKVPTTEFKKAPTIVIPPREEDEPCGKCMGRGLLHDCPSCECRCPSCAGSGHESEYRNLSFGYEKGIFAGRYLALIKDLPNLQFGKATELEPMVFRFEGGDGLLMPMRGPSRRHFELEETV